jgi:hypothetical protein
MSVNFDNIDRRELDSILQIIRNFFDDVQFCLTIWQGDGAHFENSKFHQIF